MAAQLGTSFVGAQSLGSRQHVASTHRLAAPVVRQVCQPAQSQAAEARVRIRFARFGRKYSPFYRIVAIDSKSRRDGRPIEYLGWYNPLNKETSLNAPRIQYWIGVGADPSDTVKNLLKKAMVIETAA